MLDIRDVEKKYLIGGIVALIIIIAIIVNISNRNKIDLMDYATVTITGCNTGGKATVKLNYLGNKTIQEYGKSSLEELKQHAQLELFLGTAVSFKLDKTEGLSNGDVITLSATWDKDIAKQTGLNIKGKDKKIKVEGLPDGVEVDLFKDVKLEFEGASPYLKVIVRNESSDPFIRTVNYSVSAVNPEINYFRNGDTVIVNANYNETTAENNFCIIKQTKKEYKLEGVDEYTTKYEDIDEETLQKIQEQAKSLIEAKLTSNIGYFETVYPGEMFGIVNFDSVKIEKLEVKQKYLLSLKNGAKFDSWIDNYNELVLVYELKVKDEHNAEGTTVYVPVVFDTLIQREGKTDVDVMEGYISKAQQNMDNINREIVTAKKDRYQVQEIKN